jgi:hypothetical protein
MNDYSHGRQKPYWTACCNQGLACFLIDTVFAGWLQQSKCCRKLMRKSVPYAVLWDKNSGIVNQNQSLGVSSPIFKPPWLKSVPYAVLWDKNSGIVNQNQSLGVSSPIFKPPWLKSVPYAVLWDKNRGRVHQASLSRGVWSYFQTSLITYCCNRPINWRTDGTDHGL